METARKKAKEESEKDNECAHEIATPKLFKTDLQKQHSICKLFKNHLDNKIKIQMEDNLTQSYKHLKESILLAAEDAYGVESKRRNKIGKSQKIYKI